MHKTTTARVAMISKLVAHSVSTAVTEKNHVWLTEIFDKGFVGYNRLSDNELKWELEVRGLAPSSDPTDDDDDFDDADSLTDDEMSNQLFQSRSQSPARSMRGQS